MTRKIQIHFSKLLALKAAKQGRTNIPISEVERNLAERGTPVSRSTLEAYKKGSITRFDEHVLLAICDYLECSLDKLLEIDEMGKIMPSHQILGVCLMAGG